MWKWPRKQPNPQPYDDSRLIRRYPELAYLDNPQDRSTAYITAVTAAGKGTGVWILLLTAVFVLCWLTLVRILERYAPSSWWQSVEKAGIALCFVHASWIILRFRHRQFNHALREQLARRGIPICVKCGYDLRGQPESRCPECGVRFNPELLKGVTSPPLPQSPVEQQPTPPAKRGWKAARREHKATQRLAVFPDLALFPIGDREDVWARVPKSATTSTVVGVTIVSAVTAATFGILLIFVAPRIRPPAKPLGLTLLFTVLVAQVFGVVWLRLRAWLRGKHTERFLREELNRRGHALCLKCGYDLKGQPEPCCPECGSPFDPALLKSATPPGPSAEDQRS